MTHDSDPEMSEESSDHEKSEEEEDMFRKLESELDNLAWDPDLIEDLKKLKRSTENKEVQVDDDFGAFNKKVESESNSSSLHQRVVSEDAERAAKSIGGTITNA